MHVHVGRSGGFAGLRLEGDVDTSTLAPDERGRLEQLIAHLRSSRGPSGPDLFQYDLTITTDDGESRGGAPAVRRRLSPLRSRCLWGRSVDHAKPTP